MDKKFIVTSREDKVINFTIRIEKTLQEQYDKLAYKSNRSRNELISMALQFAIDNLEFIESDKKLND